jgi:ABC-type antimicrobial peptide transport system permease subunit
MALGADRKDVLRLVACHAGWLLGLGSIIGISIAVLVTKPLTLFLVAGLTPSDPLTYAAVIAVLAMVGIAATLGPVLRALRVDPMTALRYE